MIAGERAILEEAYKMRQVYQKPIEILGLMRLLSAYPPQRMVEIGSAEGGSLYVLSRACRPNATIVSVDNRPKNNLNPTVPGQRFIQIAGDSGLEATRDTVSNAVEGTIDFLFIDGDHAYLSVKRDFELYSPLVRKDGLVAFHDIVEHPPNVDCHVAEYWREIKDKYPHLEMVENPLVQKDMGIGILWQL